MNIRWLATVLGIAAVAAVINKALLGGAPAWVHRTVSTTAFLLCLMIAARVSKASTTRSSGS